MTQAEFNRYWVTFFDYSNPLNDPGSVSVGPGSASFSTGQYFYIGISQSISPGRYNLDISLDGVFDTTHYFKLQSGNNLIYTFTSRGEYSFPIDITSDNIQLIWTGSDTSYTKSGSLYYIKLEAPQTSYTDTVYTIYGTISRARSDGKEAYTGELGGSEIKVTVGEQFPNPYLNFNNTYSSSNPGFNFSRLYYSQDATGCGGAQRWEYATQQIIYPTTVKIFYNGGNTKLYYKLDTSFPNYNDLGSGTYSTTSPTARSFTLLNSGDIISIGASQYLSFACSSSTYIDSLNTNGGISICEINNPNIVLSSFNSIVYTYNSCA